MTSKIFLLPNEKNKWEELSKKELAEMRKTNKLKEGDLIVRSGNVQQVKPVTKLSLEKKE